jgi:hypothetical protein
MPINKNDAQWKDYENKDRLYRGFILDLLMANKELAYTIEELRAHVGTQIGLDAVQKDTNFEGNIREALMDQRISFTLLNGSYYYSLKDSAPTR